MRRWFQFLGRNSGRSDDGNELICVEDGESFNSSVGILVVRTPSGNGIQSNQCWFQFLGRNSGRSDDTGILGRARRSEFQFLGRNSGRSDIILCAHIHRGAKFQFLGRNSGRSDSAGSQSEAAAASVSIPRSEFWSFGPKVAGCAANED